MSFYERFSNENIHINNTEKKIIEYILERANSFSKIKLTDIANDLFLSSNTIIRLCKKLGYSGFSELKYDIINNNYEKVSDSNEHSHITIQNSILQTLSLNKKETFKECATLIKDSNKVIIFSLGLSQYPALSFDKKLQYFNKICLVPEDRDATTLFANNLKDGDLAIIVSSSGNTDIMRKISSIITTKNVSIISITGFSQNIVSHFSDISLYAYLKDYNIDGHDLTSRIGFNIIFDLLFEEYSNL